MTDEPDPCDEDFPLGPEHFTSEQLTELRDLAFRVQSRATWFVGDCNRLHHSMEEDPKPELLRDVAAIESLVADLRKAIEKHMGQDNANA